MAGLSFTLFIINCKFLNSLSITWLYNVTFKLEKISWACLYPLVVNSIVISTLHYHVFWF